MTLRLAINGLGRIGRCVLRAKEELAYDTLSIVAVNGPAAIEDHVHLLQYDSVHGRFPGKVSAEGETLVMGNTRAHLTHERDPTQLPWAKEGVDIALECTGVFNNRAQSAMHLTAGAKKVLVSAPCKQADATIVWGVNQETLTANHQVISVGSCTTNCLAPMAKAMYDTIGIVHGFMTTIHAYTNDQHVLDKSHKDLRRARACALSMIPTSTGAAKALGEVIPALAGRLDGTAIRVPVANVSLVDLTFVAARDTSVEEILSYFDKYAAGPMKHVLAVSRAPLVSIDFNHDRHSCIIDASEIRVLDKRFVRIAAWYDNEWAFSVRMLDLAVYLGRFIRG